jgi:2-succinyl-5-enolpyruvyl-6-hydroxy-3-cyclohexene-1-carboxylate synthase
VSAPNINAFLAEMLIDELYRYGTGMICISPGSRSTPLTMAAAEHPQVGLRINIDERASAFYAIGYARAAGKAAAVICTSGTAVTNLFPAVVEAYQSRLPLIVLTADRPEELQNCGANQAINQENIFGQYAVGFTIPAPDTEFDPVALLEKLDECLHDSNSTVVHINCRFREPLAPEKMPYEHDKIRAMLNQYRGRQAEKTNPPLLATSGPSPSEIASLLNESENGLIVAGPESPFRTSRMVGELSKKLNWPIVADILSQYRSSASGLTLSHYDLILDDEAAYDNLRPDTIVHTGGLPTSKRLNRFLLACKGIEYIKIQDHDRTIDPDHLETKRVVCQVDEFLKEVMAEINPRDTGEYCNMWLDLDKLFTDLRDKLPEYERLNESSLAIRLGQLLDDKNALFLSSSMPVRDADTFTSFGSKDIMVGANRGASGIDGVIASACGFAEGSRRTTTLVIGDLAFLHDLNSLAMVKRSEMPVIIIVINNNGGGIFHFLPVAQFPDNFEEYFATPHGLNFEKAAELFDLGCFHPKSPAEFIESYQNIKASYKSAIIEITCDRNQNLNDHKKIRSQLRDAVSQKMEKAK